MSSGIHHSTGFTAEEGHPREQCPGDNTCPVISAGYDTIEES